MLILARDIPNILNLERLHGAAHIEFGLSLYGVSDSHIRHFDRGLVARGRLVIDGDETNDVELIPDILIQIERAILRMAEVKDDRVSAANRFGQCQSEKAGRVGFRVNALQAICRDAHAADRQLLAWVRGGYDDRTPEQNGLLLLRANQREHPDSQKGNRDDCDPEFDLMSVSHQEICDPNQL